MCWAQAPEPLRRNWLYRTRELKDVLVLPAFSSRSYSFRINVRVLGFKEVLGLLMKEDSNFSNSRVSTAEYRPATFWLRMISRDLYISWSWAQCRTCRYRHIPIDIIILLFFILQQKPSPITILQSLSLFSSILQSTTIFSSLSPLPSWCITILFTASVLPTHSTCVSTSQPF